jgi:hypothetical protein
VAAAGEHDQRGVLQHVPLDLVGGRGARGGRQLVETVQDQHVPSGVQQPADPAPARYVAGAEDALVRGGDLLVEPLSEVLAGIPGGQ